METETLDKTSEIAKETLAGMEAENKAKETEAAKKAEGEPKDAPPGNSSPGTEKTEGKTDEEKETEAKEQTEKDTKLLESNDNDLNEDEKTRKQELVKAKEDAKTPEEKQKDWQENVNKRIGELSGELKAEKNGRVNDAETIKTLEEKIAGLKGDLESAGSIESDNDKLMKSEEEIYAKMVDEDKNLPREKRREMSEEELEEFLLEDHAKAQRWLAKNELRRDKDRANKVKSKEAADNISKSAEQFFTKFPECNQETRHKELASQGKTDNEAIDVISGENSDFKLMMEIIREDKKYVNPASGPGLLMAEMETRKAKSDKKMYSAEELEKAKEEAAVTERERIASIDAGITSSASGQAVKSNDPLYQAKWAEWVKASKRPAAIGQDWSEEAFKKTLEYGDKIRKANPGH